MHLPLRADDLYAAARPEARCPRGDHRLSIRTAADTARRFDPHRRAHGLAHQCDIGRRRAARGEPRRGLDEVCPRLLREAAGRALLRVGQKAVSMMTFVRAFPFAAATTPAISART